MMMEVFHAAFAGGAKEVTSPPPPSLQSSQSLRLGFLKLWSFKKRKTEMCPFLEFGLRKPREKD